MGCEKIRLLLSAYLDKVTDEEQTRAVRNHLESCTRCREELSQLHRLCQLLHNLEQPRPPRCLWRDISNRLHI